MSYRWARRPLARRLQWLTGALMMLAACTGSPGDGGLAGTAGTVSRHQEMSTKPSTWQATTLPGGGRLEFVRTGYRMTARGWPVVSPSQDPDALDLDPVRVEATFERISGAGLSGVACAVTEQGAYVFVVGSQEDGRPYYGIALLKDGRARVLRDSADSGSAPAEEVLAPGVEARVGAHCRSGEKSGTAMLGMTVDGQQLLDIEVTDGEPVGQVGLVALSRTTAELVVDVREVTIIGSP